jgi:hypothetical protein
MASHRGAPFWAKESKSLCKGTRAQVRFRFTIHLRAGLKKIEAAQRVLSAVQRPFCSAATTTAAGRAQAPREMR